ncbi:MAG: thioredoxin domain-containing protein [Alphaproteobacteria bacterium]
MTLWKCALAFVLMSLPAMAADKPLTRADVEGIVADYIAKNGDKVMTGIMDWQQRQKDALVKDIVRPYNPVMGPANAPITIVEFSEFECPFCQRVQDNLKPVRAKYGNRIRWVYKHFPLEFHAKAKPAAYASMAAHKQGKFWEFSDAVWAKQNFLSDQLTDEVAKSLKLDMAKFKADKANPAFVKQVEADMVDGTRVGVQGTPFFLINGKPLSGAQPTEAFVEIIEAELKAKGK